MFVAAPSAPPLEVVASSRLDSISSVIIQWKPPMEDDWNGVLLGYMIRYKPRGYPDNTLSYENVTNYLVTSFQLNDLIVFQEYEMAVAAYNAKGTGVYSGYVTVRTREGKPETAPTNLSLMAINSTAIKVTWMPPDPGFINGINQGYKIEALRPDVAASEVTLIVPSNTSNMLGEQMAYLARLAKYTHYSVTVLCFTSRGDGPKTVPVEKRTLEDGKWEGRGGEGRGGEGRGGEGRGGEGRGGEGRGGEGRGGEGRGGEGRGGEGRGGEGGRGRGGGREGGREGPSEARVPSLPPARPHCLLYFFKTL